MLTTDEQFDLLRDFFLSGRCLELKRGQIIDRSDEVPFGVYYIESGFVKAYAITKYGEENLLVIRKTHEIFPLIRTFTGLKRDILYETMDNCVIYKRMSDEYIKFIEDHPEIQPLLTDIAIDMYLLHSEHLNSLEYRTVRERVISFLLILEHRFGRKVPEGILLDAPIKRQDIASSVSATRETTSRVITALTRKGLITEKDGRIVLCDKASLRAFL